MGLLIKRKLTLEHLGEDYRDAYLIFKPFPIAKYSEFLSDYQKIKDDSIKSIEQMLKLIKQHFVSGQFPNESGDLQEVKKEDLDDLDGETVTLAFSLLAGGLSDPKETGQ